MTSSPPSTRGEARDDAIRRLRAAAIETAVLDADLLLAFVLDVRKEDLYAHPEPSLLPDALVRYHELISRRARGEPVAYLRGAKEFYGLELAVDRRVLIPRPETELLVEEAARRLRSRVAPLICDLGTGSGAVALALATALPRARIVATDVSADALEVARVNARRHRVVDRIEFRAGDLFAPIHERLDAVVANLPYLTTAEVDAARGTSIEFEPRAALDGGEDGLDAIRRAIPSLPRALVPGGVALFECAPSQARTIASLLSEALGSEAEVVRDFSGHERLVLSRAV
jgi:release factor glutamine methyltransferase